MLEIEREPPAAREARSHSRERVSGVGPRPVLTAAATATFSNARRVNSGWRRRVERRVSPLWSQHPRLELKARDRLLKWVRKLVRAIAERH